MWTHYEDEATWCHLYKVFTYIYFLLIEKDLCECRNVSVNFSCVYLSLIQRSLHFFGKNFPFYSYFCVTYTSVLSFSIGNLHWFSILYKFLFWDGLLHNCLSLGQNVFSILSMFYCMVAILQALTLYVL